MHAQLYCTIQKTSGCPENFKMSISNLPITYMMGKSGAEYRQGKVNLQENQLEDLL